MAMVASRRRLPSAVSAGVVLAWTVGLWWHAASAGLADDRRVVVQAAEEGGQYTPAEVTIELGDTVTWVWDGDGHSVTHEAGPNEEPLFDTHPLCPLECGQHGETFAFSDFPDVGDYEYFSRGDPARMRGVVYVIEASDEPSPTASPPPAKPSPTQDPQPSPTASSEPAPSPEASATGEPSPEPAPPPPTGPREAAPQSIDRDPVADAPTAGTPTVAADDASPSPVPDPTFEEFPEASAPAGDRGDEADVPGEVALGGSDDTGGPARTVWAIVGGASVLGTLGAFGRTVLFADAWDA